MARKTIITPLLITFFSFSLTAQPSIQWQKTFGGSDYDEAHSIQETRDDGFIVAGTASSDDGDVGPNHGFYEAWVLKLDSIGYIQWKRFYGGSGLDEVFAIHQTTDGGYIAAGYTDSNDGDVSGNHGDYDAWVLKLDSIGGIQWQICLGGSGWEEAWDIQQTSDGGYILAGRSGSTNGDVTVNHGSLDYWVVKLNNVGMIEWQKSFGGSLLDLAYSICETDDGGYIVAGESNSPDGDVTGNHGSSDYWVVKLNFEGKIEWQKTLGGTGLDRANYIHQTIDGGFIVLGQSRSSNGDVTGAHGGYDFWVVKLDELGNIEWQKAFGGSGEDYGRFIRQTVDDGYIMTGLTESNNGDVLNNDGGADIWVVKLTQGGAIHWQKTIGGSQAEIGFAVRQTSDLGYILTGYTRSNNGDVSGNHGEADFWIVKLAPPSSPTTQPQTQALQLYPNPTTHSITIQVPEAESTLSIQITDLLGRELVRQTIPNGGSVAIETLPNGLYLVTATTDAGKVFLGNLSKQD